jgi:Protein of unknown function (DUF5132)
MAPAERPINGHTRPRRIGTVVTALAAGLVGGLVAPLLYPAIARGARPATKRVLKVGFAAVERGRVAAAELAEHTSDLVAEARSEYEQEQKLGTAPAQTANPDDTISDVVNLRGSGRGAAAN